MAVPSMAESVARKKSISQLDVLSLLGIRRQKRKILDSRLSLVHNSQPTFHKRSADEVAAPDYRLGRECSIPYLLYGWRDVRVNVLSVKNS